MALNQIELPQRVRVAYLSGLHVFLRRLKSPDILPPLRSGLRGYRVFVLTLEDLVSRDDLALAREAGWRVYSGDPGKSAVSGDIPAVDRRTEPRMTSLSRSPLVSDVLGALHEVESMARARDPEFELCLLSVPGLLLEAAWLKTADATGDLIVPLRSANREFVRLQPYQRNEFLDVARSLVDGFLAFDRLER